MTGGARHTQAAVVISLDLTTFLAAVTAAGIYGVLRRHGYPESVAHAITGLCTHAVPPRVLTAMMRNCVVTGPASQNRAGHPDFRAHLLGRISWVEQLNPQRGARLRARFADIRWYPAAAAAINLVALNRRSGCPQP